MSYQIQYDPPGGPSPTPASRHPWLLTLCCFGAFLFLVKTLWPEGQAMLRRLLLPGDPETTQTAAKNLIAALRWGEPFYSAAKTFCQEILAHGTLG